MTVTFGSRRVTVPPTEPYAPPPLTLGAGTEKTFHFDATAAGEGIWPAIQAARQNGQAGTIRAEYRDIHERPVASVVTLEYDPQVGPPRLIGTTRIGDEVREDYEQPTVHLGRVTFERSGHADVEGVV